MVQLHVTQTCVWYNPQYRIFNLVSTTNCIGTAFHRKENITTLFLCKKLDDRLSQMKEKKQLHSWDWIPKWDDDNAAVSEDVQEQGKEIWASGLRNSGNSTLACWGEVSIHTLNVSIAYTVGKGSQSLLLI